MELGGGIFMLCTLGWVHFRSWLLIGPKLDLIKGVRSKIRLYMRTFSIIPDSTHKIYKEMIVMDGVPDFHPP